VGEIIKLALEVTAQKNRTMDDTDFKFKVVLFEPSLIRAISAISFICGEVWNFCVQPGSNPEGAK